MMSLDEGNTMIDLHLGKTVFAESSRVVQMSEISADLSPSHKRDSSAVVPRVGDTERSEESKNGFLKRK